MSTEVRAADKVVVDGLNGYVLVVAGSFARVLVEVWSNETGAWEDETRVYRLTELSVIRRGQFSALGWTPAVKFSDNNSKHRAAGAS